MKTYKLFINGSFPRSESGRVYEIKDSKGKFLANPCLGSRKELRESVVAARAAHRPAKYNNVMGRTSRPNGKTLTFTPARMTGT